MTTLNESEIEDLANIATRLKAENVMAAKQIVELQHEVAELAAEAREGSMTLTVLVILGTGLACFTAGWRLADSRDFAAGVATVTQCEEDVE